MRLVSLPWSLQRRGCSSPPRRAGLDLARRRAGAAPVLARRRRVRGGQHRGVDIGAAAGDAVRAPAAGARLVRGHRPGAAAAS